MPKLNIQKLAEAQAVKKAKNSENDGETAENGEKAQKSAGNRAKTTLTYHKMRRITSELNLEQTLPWHFETGTAYHVISQGDVDSLTYLRMIVKQQKLKYLILSTWCMSITDIEEIASWIEKGYIARMDFYMGEIFTSCYGKEFIVLKDLCNTFGGRVALFHNHSKVMAGFGEKFDFAIESSANVNTNPRCEQTTITLDRGLALFYKEFYDGINSIDNSFDNWRPFEL